MSLPYYSFEYLRHVSALVTGRTAVASLGACSALCAADHVTSVKCTRSRRAEPQPVSSLPHDRPFPILRSQVLLLVAPQTLADRPTPSADVTSTKRPLHHVAL